MTSPDIMTPSDLQAWVASRGGIRVAARELDISTPRLYRMIRGETPIREHIALACAAIVYGIPPWPRSAFHHPPHARY